MCFLNSSENTSVQMLDVFHITAFYIARSQRKCRPYESLGSIYKVMELIRQLRCEISHKTRPWPWRQLKARISNVNLCNTIYEDYLVDSLRQFLYAFKNNTHTLNKIKHIFC